MRLPLCLKSVLFTAAFFVLAPAFAAATDLDTEVRRLIVSAGLLPWERKPISLNEELGDESGRKVTLRQFVTGERVIIAYQFAPG